MLRNQYQEGVNYENGCKGCTYFNESTKSFEYYGSLISESTINDYLLSKGWIANKYGNWNSPTLRYVFGLNLPFEDLLKMCSDVEDRTEEAIRGNLAKLEGEKYEKDINHRKV